MHLIEIKSDKDCRRNVNFAYPLNGARRPFAFKNESTNSYLPRATFTILMNKQIYIHRTLKVNKVVLRNGFLLYENPLYRSLPISVYISFEFENTLCGS